MRRIGAAQSRFLRGTSRQAMAVVARGVVRPWGGNLERPVHPARTKNDRVRQVSWLAGQ